MADLTPHSRQPSELELPSVPDRSVVAPTFYPRFEASPPIDPFERLDLSSVFSAVWQARFRIAGSAILFGVWVWLLAGLLTPRYEAMAFLRIDGDGFDALSEGRRDPNRFVDPVVLSTRVQSIKSAAVLGAALDAAGIAYSAEFNEGLARTAEDRRKDQASNARQMSETEKQASLLTEFAKRVDVWQIDQSGVAAIKVKADDPILAARAANAIGDSYIAQQIQEKRKTRLQALDALLAQQNEMTRKLRGVEDSIASVRADRKLVFTGAQDIRGQVLGKTRELLIAAEADLAEVERKRIVIEQARDGGVESLSLVTFSDLIQKLKEQRAVLSVELGQLASETGPSHPRYQAVVSGIAKLDRAIDEELRRVGASVRTTERALRDRVQTLSKRLSELNSEVTDQATSRVHLDSLETEVQALRFSRESLKNEIDKLKTALGLEQSEATFVSRALPPEKPSFPRRSLIAAGGTVAWGGFFAFAVGVAALWNRQVRNPADTAAFETIVHCPVVGALPAAGRRFAITARQLPLEYAEGLKRIAEAIRLGSVGPVSIVISSLKQGDGGTTAAVALARLSGQAGLTTVLVELDARRRITELLAAQSAFGLADCAQSGVNPVAAIVPKPDLGFHVLAHGRTGDGLGTRADAALDQVFETLKSLYRVVIISAPPLSLSPRAFWVGRNVDHVVVVTTADKRRADVLARFFRFFGGAVPGNVAVVFNHVDAKYHGSLV